jgi:hypothetical protein
MPWLIRSCRRNRNSMSGCGRLGNKRRRFKCRFGRMPCMSSTVVQTRFTANDGLFDRRGHVHAPGSECDVQSDPHRNARPHGDCPVKNARKNCVTESRDFETTGLLRVEAQRLVTREPSESNCPLAKAASPYEAATSSAAARFARSSGTPIEQNPFFVRFPRRHGVCAASPGSDEKGRRSSSLTLLALRAVGVMDARARGLVVQAVLAWIPA